MAASGLHISISAEPIAHIGGLTISNSMTLSVIVSLCIIAIAFIGNRQLKNTGKPSGFQNFLEYIVESLYNLVDSITGNREKTRRFFPLIATFFLFILLNNWFGLIPGVGTIGFRESAHEVTETTLEGAAKPEAVTTAELHGDASHATETVTQANQLTAAPAENASHEESIFVPYLRAGTADLNTTLALALISMISVQVFGVTYQKLGYFKKFLNFSNPIMFFVGILETVSELGKIISFAFRLFGNIFAGEVLLAVIGFLIPVIAPMPFYGLEIFVGLIQALVFALLSAVFYNVATLGHEEH